MKIRPLALLVTILVCSLFSHSALACWFTRTVFVQSISEREWKPYSRALTSNIGSSGLVGVFIPFMHPKLQGVNYWFETLRCADAGVNATVSLETNMLPMDEYWDVVWKQNMSFLFDTEYEFYYSVLDKNFLVKFIFNP